LYVLAKARAKSYLTPGKGIEYTPIPWKSAFTELEQLRRTQGIMQHHDAITGTMRAQVLADYISMVSTDVAHAEGIVPSMVAVMMAKAVRLRQAFESNASPLPSYSLTPAWKTQPDGSKHMVAVLYNPLAWSSKRIVTVTVQEARIRVVDNNGDEVPSQVRDATRRLLHMRDVAREVWWCSWMVFVGACA